MEIYDLFIKNTDCFRTKIYLNIVIFVFIIIVIFAPYCTKAQVDFPVSTSIQLSPPYSLTLADYVNNPSKINITLRVPDADAAPLQLKLKLIIKSNSISIQSKSTYIPTPIQLSGGDVEILDGTDLAGYFNLENLDFTGYSKQAYTTSQKLPEGIYEFAVEVYEAKRDIILSNIALTLAVLELNDPPIWTFPANNEVVEATNPQNVLVSWLPRHTGSPNSSFTTQYEVTMVELASENQNPNDAINSQSQTPFFSTTTSETSVILGPSLQAMVPGRKYAIRIKAVDNAGFGLFRNNGYSEVLSFVFGQPCLPPTVFRTTKISQRSATLSWTPSDRNDSYTVDVREAIDGYKDSDWHSASLNTSQSVQSNLEAGKKYEYRVMAGCKTLISEYSEIQSFNTLTSIVDNFSCDANATPSINGSTAVKTTFNINDKFKINGLWLTATTVSAGAGGKFTGSGYLQVPMLGFVKIKATFADISINNNDEALPGGTITIDAQ
ncbi:MAG: fibronectin type III domain-containing protein [Cytophagales bacterium]|nr:fibronectin type III domain-containing protein [Cytophagales bacterium]